MIQSPMIELLLELALVGCFGAVLVILFGLAIIITKEAFAK